METILTMRSEGNFVTFIIESDGSAKETKTGEIIPDFAATFELLSAMGYETVTETNLAETENKGKADIIPFPVNTRETFRDQWEEYLTEYSDNLEVEFN